MGKLPLYNNIFLFLIILSLFHFSSSQKFIPESFKEKDMLLPENDKINNYYYSLIDAKVLTKEDITLHLKKQGIHLTRDNSCITSDDINIWDGIMEKESEFQEIYENARYNSGQNYIEYKFPVDKIENQGYELFHKVRLINREDESTKLTISLIYTDNTLTDEVIFSENVGRNYLFELRIICTLQDNTHVVKYINKLPGFGDIGLKGGIDKIKFEYTNKGISPAIALHWTYLRMKATLSNFSFKGNTLCDKIHNPCVNGYYCQGGVCKQCHPSCYDCVNGGLSTDCYSKCNTHSVSLSPEKGSCSIGYVDLNQFEDFKIENIVPPPRNNRMTISLWMFVSSYPDNEVTAYLNNSFSDNINIAFTFTSNNLNIKCANAKNKNGIDVSFLNTWIYIKCAIKYDHDTIQGKNLMMW